MKATRMGTIEPLRKKFYIMDNSENFYRLDKHGQLVVADGKEDAAFFTYEEAGKKIGKGKRAHFYKIVPTEMYPAASTVLDQLADNAPAQEDNRFDAPELVDLSRVGWLLYLQNFSYIVANTITFLSHKPTHHIHWPMRKNEAAF